jgi:hypothetical protein
MRTLIFLILIVFSITLIVYGCEKSDDKNKQLILTGKLVSHTSCKNGLKSISGSTLTSDSLSCINYSFDDSNKKLIIKHINAGFNCCPDSLYCKLSLSNDTVIIQEFEKSHNCKCNCLYDLEIEISGVDSKKYQVKLIEPYSGEQDKLNFGLDLGKDKNGTFCVIRKLYPWRI